MNIYLVNIVTVLVAAVVAIVAVRWAYFKILHIAKDKGLVDNPDARKLQKEPIPVMGGIAVFFGMAFGLLAGYTVGGIVGAEFSTLMMPVLGAMVVMLYIGAMDDIMGLTPRARFVIEIVTILGLIFASGGCIDTFHGLWGVGTFSWWLAVPLTVFAGVGIINAVNMIDGVNGLSSSLCMLCSVLYGIVFMRAGDVSNAVLAFSAAAALLPFMIHNVFGLRSRMFIGDAGTMVMGLLMTWFTMSMLRSDSPITYYNVAQNVNLVAFALAVLCVPVFDTVRVMTMRIAHKKSPFHPDKTHLHHVFVNVGVSHFFTTVTEVLIMLLVMVVWMVSVALGAAAEWQLYIVVVASVVFVWGTYALLRYHADRHTEFLHRVVSFSIRTHWGRTTWWKKFTAWLDAPEDRLVARMEKEAEKSAMPENFGVQDIDPDNLKEQDRKKILDFMKGRAEVMVYDILKHSGADKLRVYTILFEEEMKGHIRVIKTHGLGAPEIVTLKN